MDNRSACALTIPHLCMKHKSVYVKFNSNLEFGSFEWNVRMRCKRRQMGNFLLQHNYGK